MSRHSLDSSFCHRAQPIDLPEYLLERTSNDVVQLLKRFENIIALAPVRLPPFFTTDISQKKTHDLIRNSNQQLRGRDRTATAVDAYQMEVETAALVSSYQVGN